MPNNDPVDSASKETELMQHFDRYVDTNAQKLLDQIVALCQIPSVSPQPSPALEQAAEMVQSLCAQAGIASERVDQAGAPPIILGTAGTGPRCLMIYNHYDVQPADPLEKWTTPPFQPALRNGSLYGRGVADNKADLVARLFALAAYQETVGPLPLRVLTVFEGEEETGSGHLLQFARKRSDILSQADGCLWEYGHKDLADRPVVGLGVKGILSVELRVRTADTDAHSGFGGIFPNAAWRLVEAMGTLRGSDGRVTIDGLWDHVRPPTDRELGLLARIPHDDVSMKEAFGLRNGFMGDLAGQQALQRLLLEPALSINGVLSGYTGPGSKTVIPSQAMAKLDLRLVPDLDPSLALTLLRAHLDRRGYEDIEVVDCKDGLLPARTDPSAGIARAVSAALKEVHQVQPVIYPSSAGSGPMGELCQAHGIPVASTGVAWTNSRTHAPDENIRVADLIQGVKVVGRLIGEFARG